MKKFFDWFSFENKAMLSKNLVAQSSKGEKTLKIVAIISWCVLVAAQITMLFVFNGEHVSDAQTYIGFAKHLAAKGDWYPASGHLQNTYLYANGYINLLSLIFRVTTNLRVVYALNIILTQLLLFSCVYILRKTFDRSCIYYWFIIIFSFLTTFWGETVSIRTELIFTSLCFFALAFLYNDKKWRFLICGAILALANWIRPLGIAFLIGAAFVLLYKKEKIRSYVGLVAGYLCIVVVIGTFTYIQCGQFVYKATTLGYNLLMSANDDADGSYMDVFSEGEVGYISPEKKKGMTYKDYDKYYMNLSKEWIMKNPGKYIAQLPKKVFYTFATETYAGAAYFDNKINTSGIEYIRALGVKLMGKSDEPFHIGDILICFAQLWYMLIVLLFIIGTVMMFTQKYWRAFLPYYIMLAGGTAITLVIVGGARYHFPYLPIFFMGAAAALQCLMVKITKKR